LLASPAFFDVLERERFTGWGSYPVAIQGPQGPIAAGYRGLSVSGRCGEPDLAAGAPIPDRPDYRRGYVIAESSWDGSDIFQAETGEGPFVTPAVRDALRASKPGSGVVLTPVSEVEYWAE
jgi:hypothetical protein